MSVEEAFIKLKAFVKRRREVTVILAEKIEGTQSDIVAGAEDEPDADSTSTGQLSEPPFIIQRLNFTEPVADDFRSIATSFVKQSDGFRLRKYDPGYKPDSDEIIWLKLSDFPELMAVEDLMSTYALAPMFDANPDFVERLHYYVIALGQQSTQARFYRSFGPKKELSRSGLFALFQQGGTYNKITEKVFLFDSKIDCVSWDGYLYMMRQSTVLSMFGLYQLILRKAARVVNKLLRRIPIANEQEFKEACISDVRFAAKLASIARKPYIDRVTAADLERTIREFDLPVRVQGPSAKRELVFDPSIKNRWLILKLLDDDYLGSTMTQEKYEVNSKTSVA
jgi:hypothetical protein